MKRPSIDCDDEEPAKADDGPPRAATPTPNPTYAPGEIKLDAAGGPGEAPSPSEPMSPSEAFKRAAPRRRGAGANPDEGARAAAALARHRPGVGRAADASEGDGQSPGRARRSAESPPLPPARPLGTDAGSPTLSRKAAPAPAPTAADRRAEESEAPTPDVPLSRPLGTGPERRSSRGNDAEISPGACDGARIGSGTASPDVDRGEKQWHVSCRTACWWGGSSQGDRARDGLVAL